MTDTSRPGAGRVVPQSVWPCDEDVYEPPHYFHSHNCRNKARFLAESQFSGEQRLLCGRHVKWYRRYGPPTWVVKELDGAAVGSKGDT